MNVSDQSAHSAQEQSFIEEFSDPANVIRKLKSAISENLIDLMDLSSLTLQSTDWPDPPPGGIPTHLLYSVRLKKSPERLVMIYLLYEPLSSSLEQSFLPMRLLSYMVRIWEQFAEQYPQAEYLPMIVPVLVLYDPQEDGWNAIKINAPGGRA